eukprot:214762-Chlamydomonas_euryale.AAC.2
MCDPAGPHLEDPHSANVCVTGLTTTGAPAASTGTGNRNTAPCARHTLHTAPHGKARASTTGGASALVGMR